MEQQVLQLLQATTVPDTNTIKSAERSLRNLHASDEYPFALVNITRHTQIDAGTRKAALSALRTYINSSWSPTFDEAVEAQVNLSPEARARLRSEVLAICTGEDASNDPSQSLAATVVSKIASADFPDQWPELFPQLINVLNTSQSIAAVQGALRVLYELVDSGLSDEQFFIVARDLVGALQHVTIKDGQNPLVQATALRGLGACLDNLEQVLGTEHAPAVKGFLNESMQGWMTFFMNTLTTPLPSINLSDFEGSANEVIGDWKGIVALKIQVVQMLVKVKRVYTASLTPHVFTLFQIIWEDIIKSAPAYEQLFVTKDGDSKLVDNDGLSYTLDAYVIEAVDFLSSVLKAKAVRHELTQQTKQSGAEQHAAPWLQELLRVMVLYSRIPREEEEMWQLDANIYLSETTSQTANYTPRTACAELVSQTLIEWLNKSVVHALVQFYVSSLGGSVTSWKDHEAYFFLLTSALKEIRALDVDLEPETTNLIQQQISGFFANESPFLRGAAHLTASALYQVAPQQFQDTAASALELTIRAFVEDDSTIVCACCLIAGTQFLEVLPANITMPRQAAIIASINHYLSKHDLQDDLEDSDDIKVAIITLLRDAMLLDTSKVLSTPAMDIFFNLAGDGADNFMISELLTETFELVVEKIADDGHNEYIAFCQKVIPALSGAFHLGTMKESRLTDLAAELSSKLAEFGTDPLPDGFISALMPPLQNILMQSTEGAALRPATSAVSHMLSKAASQFMAWNHDGKSSIELVLTIIDRLISSPQIEESAADEVGSLASSVIDKCGAEILGSYLSALLQAVAVRLGSAERIQFIQSLLMVFASLAIKTPSDVVNFLESVNVNGVSGLQVVMTKWLENSVHFAGFEEIRLNCMALSKIYSLHDPRIAAVTVKGDLVVVETGRIKTRSQARLNPDTYTQIPATLKILKLLIDELKSAALSQFTDMGAARAAAEALEDDEDSLASDDGEDGDEWEDLAGTGDGSLNLADPKVREELMGLVGEGHGSAPNLERLRDDQSADYLINWFKEEAGKEGFSEMFAQLKPEEQKTLQDLVK